MLAMRSLMIWGGMSEKASVRKQLLDRSHRHEQMKGLVGKRLETIPTIERGSGIIFSMNQSNLDRHRLRGEMNPLQRINQQHATETLTLK